MSIRDLTARTTATLAVALVVLAPSPSAWAFWSGGGAGAGAATTGTLSEPTSVSATASGTSVAVSWTRPASVPAGATIGYRVTDNAGSTVCGAPTAVSGTTCSYTAAPGTYSYAVTAVLNSWTAKSAVSNQVTVANPATPAISASAGSGQTTTVSTAFATALAAKVSDSANNPVSGVTVTFTAPTTGASGTFTGGTTSTTATTNASGVATAPTFTANSTTGSYSVTATASGVTGSASFSLTNQAPAVSAPTVTSATPALAQGVVSKQVTIIGTGFQQGATVRFGHTGITGGTVTVVSATELKVPVTVARDVSPSSYAVTVTNTNGGAGTNSTALTVNAAPIVSTAGPALGQGATSRTVTVTGTGFQSGATIAFGHAGITGGAVTVVSGTQLTVPVSVATSVPAGTYAVTVTNPDGGAGTNSTALTVNAAPTISSVSPPTLPRGATNQTVTINGSGFQTGTITVAFSNKVTVSSTGTVTRTSDSQLTVTGVTVPNGADLGPVTVTVTNPDGGVGTNTGALSITR